MPEREVLRTEMRPENYFCLLQILISNALDWLKGTESPRIRVTLRGERDRCELIFSDTGPGVPFELADVARYLALRFSGNEESKATVRNVASSRSVKLGGDQIEYEDQNPLIHRTFVEEAGRHGVAVSMDEFVAAPTR